ncbi:MAG: hypothetical protein HY921_08065 [Elusimicrobia bacterium]|nr:hypothetical protein [Elusimicrobiota bacterium]
MLGPPAQGVAIPWKFLKSLYWIAALCATVAAGDAFAGGPLRRILPRNPHELLYFNVFFGLPHIAASHLLWAGYSDYREFYGKLELRALMASLAVVGAWLFFKERAVFMAAFGAATAYHVVGQQIGFVPGHRPELRLWKRLAWAFAILNNFSWQALPAGWARAATVLSVSSLACLLWSTWRCRRLAPPGRGRDFLWLNAAMLSGVGALGLAGYPFFSILAARLIHDVTAFTFYIVHDCNKNREAAVHALYRLLAVPPRAVPAACVGSAVLLTLFLQAMREPALALVAYSLTLAHYYMEGVTWKAGSPYRIQVPFG